MNRDPRLPPQNQATRLLRTEDGATFRCLLVDEYRTHVGWFESEIPDWTVGQEVTVDNERRFCDRGGRAEPEPGRRVHRHLERRTRVMQERRTPPAWIGADVASEAGRTAAAGRKAAAELVAAVAALTDSAVERMLLSKERVSSAAEAKRLLAGDDEPLHLKAIEQGQQRIAAA